MKSYADLKLTTEYLFSVYKFRNMPVQYLPVVEEYSKRVRKIKIKPNLTFKRIKGFRAKVRYIDTFNVYKSARSSAG